MPITTLHEIPVVAIGANVSERETPHTVGIFVLSRSSVQTLVIRESVEEIDPVVLSPANVGVAPVSSS